MQKKPRTKKSKTTSSNRLEFNGEEWIRLDKADLKYLMNRIEREDSSIKEEFDQKEFETIQFIAKDKSVSLDEARKILEESNSVPGEERFQVRPGTMQMIEDYHTREKIVRKQIWIPDLVRNYIRNLKNPI